MKERIKSFKNKLKSDIKNKINSVKKWFSNKEHIIDLLVTTSLLIISGTTLSLNIYVGLYTIAAILIGLAFAVARFTGGDKRR